MQSNLVHHRILAWCIVAPMFFAGQSGCFSWNRGNSHALEKHARDLKNQRALRDGIRVGKNNTWYEFRPNCSTAIVFVHGIFSSTETCWEHKGNDAKEDAYWPSLLVADHAYDDCSIYTAGYYTEFNSGDFGIVSAADQLHSHLQDAKHKKEGSPLEFKNIVFIAHSTGGLVVREFITRHSNAFNGRNVGVILLASPALGSDYAQWFGALAKIYRNKMASDLSPSNADLSNLDKRFRDLADEDSQTRGYCLVGAEFIENKFVFGGEFSHLAPNVVSKSSQGKYFADPKIIPATDHFSIAAPSSIESEVSVYVRSWFKGSFPKADCWIASDREPITENAQDFVSMIASAENEQAKSELIRSFNHRPIGLGNDGLKWQLWFTDEHPHPNADFYLSASTKKNREFVAKWERPDESTPTKLIWARVSVKEVAFKSDGLPVLKGLKLHEVHCEVDPCEFVRERDALESRKKVLSEFTKIRSLQNDEIIVWVKWKFKLGYDARGDGDWTEAFVLNESENICSSDPDLATFRLSRFEDITRCTQGEVVEIMGWLQPRLTKPAQLVNAFIPVNQ